ncbi:MAG: hypothetical protein ACYSWS_05960 [Planctomycetota bacterium]|jgi:hypothetical protein
MVQTLHYVTVQNPVPFDEAPDGLNYEVLLKKIVNRLGGKYVKGGLSHVQYVFTNHFDAHKFEEELKNWEFKVADDFCYKP